MPFTVSYTERMRRLLQRRMWMVGALSASLVALSLPSVAAHALEGRTTVARAAAIPAGDRALTTSSTASFDVALHGADAASLGAFIASLSNTASPHYHHYLTTGQFAQRFGATSNTVAAVSHYFAGFGLRVGDLSKGRVLLHVSGSTTDIAKAFATPVATVRRSDGVLAAQFTSNASLPASLARDVVGVAGLSTVVTPSSHLVHAHASAHQVVSMCPLAGSLSTTPNELGGYPVQQQALLYGLSAAWATGNTGVGQTIATYELGAYDPADVAVYFSCYAIYSTVTPVSIDGGPSGGFSEEATLDIEETAALAPGATIAVYQGPNSQTGPTDVYQRIADDNTASIVSTSWGTCEADPSGDMAAERPIFEQMAAQGQTVVAAAGDNGSSDCTGITNNRPAVDDPASQPYVTGVGGLSVNSISPLSQTVWNSGPKSSLPGAGGGGRSTAWSHPTWQVAPGIAPTETKRLVPDLSTMADPSTGFIEYYSGVASGACKPSCPGGGWGPIGGTSIGSPIVSALVAVAAQSCNASRLGFINPALYAMAGSGFVDVTTGSNDLFHVGAYSAGVGFDLASGLGSPKPGTFIAGLCPAMFDPTKSSFTTSPGTVGFGGAAHVTANLRDTHNVAIANALVNVTAVTGASAPTGRVLINNDHASATTSGSAASIVTSDATGVVAFDVSTTAPSPVTVTVSYGAKTIYTIVVNFTAAAATTVPGRASIAQLSASVGGFVLSVRAPSYNGGAVVTSYQYSLNGGSKWVPLGGATGSVRVGGLAKGHRYSVVVRAINVNGAGAASAMKSIVTRKK